MIQSNTEINLLCYNSNTSPLTSYRSACSIPNNEEVIITGGKDSMTTVSVYSEAGHQRDLEDLIQGRAQHACSSFFFDEKMVI